MVTPPATSPDVLLTTTSQPGTRTPDIDEASADVARLLRISGRRALFLAALALLAGLQPLALLLALAGLGLLVVPVSDPPAPERRAVSSIRRVS
ncbi:hypothetical protein [Nocardia sp. NPDC049149]|uniref:hypothetical protein n=1 Tax=Nocardia sp. NPDC049149 TaxID=3364315 RepID=UPI003720E005